MPIITVLKPGLLTTIQDQGRVGYPHWGVPISGALDRMAARRANELVGNVPETPILEISLSGPALEFSAAAQIAITGANISPALDGVEVPNNCLLYIAAGQVLSFGPCRSGCRAYLAIAGEWQVGRWLGSASRALPPAEACTPLGKLEKGMSWQVVSTPPLSHATADKALNELEAPERIAEGGGPAGAAPGVEATADDPPRLRTRGAPIKPTTIYVLAGPEYTRLSKSWWAAFFIHTYTISKAADRMGYRLYERLRVPSNMGGMLSSGVLPGTVQLTPEGKAIILLADAQTTGGYYRILQLRPDSLDAMAQLKPGDQLRLVRAEQSLTKKVDIWRI